MPQYSIQHKKEELYWLHAFECIGASSGLLWLISTLRSWRQVVKPDQINIVAFAVFRDFE